MNEIDTEEYEKVIASFGKLPDTFLSFLPILVPVLLMGLGSVASVVPMAAWLKSAQGSSTVAITTTAGIMGHVQRC